MIPDREGPRARDKKIFKKRAIKRERRYFYTQRVTNGWNGLSNEIVNADKTSKFKALMDAFTAARTLVRENDIYVWN